MDDNTRAVTRCVTLLLGWPPVGDTCIMRAQLLMEHWAGGRMLQL